MAGIPIDLETFRQMFSDKRTHIAVGKVMETELASDRSQLLAKCSILTEDREVVARVAWSAIGPNAGQFSFPQPDDMVLLVFAGSNDECYLTHRLSSRTDLIPVQAEGGHTVLRALAGKVLHLLSDESILLGRGGADPEEPLVLGLVLQDLLSTILQSLSTFATDVSTHNHLDAFGIPTTPPIQAASFVAHSGDYDTFKASPVDDGEILSDLAYTEK
jgi:hypothetical protein